MTMEDATTSFNNFIAGSPVAAKERLDFEGFTTCIKFHMVKLSNASESAKVKAELCSSALQMIGSDTAQFISLFDLPTDLSKTELQDIMKEMEEYLKAQG
jgi:hypothetical protein